MIFQNLQQLLLTPITYSNLTISYIYMKNFIFSTYWMLMKNVCFLFTFLKNLFFFNLQYHIVAYYKITESYKLLNKLHPKG